MEKAKDPTEHSEGLPICAERRCHWFGYRHVSHHLDAAQVSALGWEPCYSTAFAEPGFYCGRHRTWVGHGATGHAKQHPFHATTRPGVE